MHTAGLDHGAVLIDYVNHNHIFLGGKKNGEIFVTMKNISAYEMNFAPEEMMERFVRGDASRTSDGHGLGLAIASSYTANMGGRMELAADGDLFKVILRFPEAGEDSAAGETATKT